MAERVVGRELIEGLVDVAVALGASVVVPEDEGARFGYAEGFLGVAEDIGVGVGAVNEDEIAGGGVRGIIELFAVGVELGDFGCFRGA